MTDGFHALYAMTGGELRDLRFESYDGVAAVDRGSDVCALLRDELAVVQAVEGSHELRGALRERCMVERPELDADAFAGTFIELVVARRELRDGVDGTANSVGGYLGSLLGSERGGAELASLGPRGRTRVDCWLTGELDEPEPVFGQFAHQIDESTVGHGFGDE